MEKKKGTEKIPIKFTIIGSPLYECSLTAINKEEGFKIMNQALDEVKNSIKAKNGSYLLETKPMIIGGDEKSLTEQLSEAKNKENENEKEEEIEDENEEGIRANLPQFDANEFKISKSKK
jgi:translation initiation factor 2 subunit 1